MKIPPSPFEDFIQNTGLKHKFIAEQLQIDYVSWLRKRENLFFSVEEVFKMANLFRINPEVILHLIHDSVPFAAKKRKQILAC